jgi:hypothetical protein
MRNLIKKILKEESKSFDWIEDIDDNKALERFDYIETAAEVFSGKEVEYDMAGDVEDYRELSNEEIEDKRELLEWYLANNYFSDIEVRGGKYYMTMENWSGFIDMFEDCRGGYNYICRYLAKAVLVEDDYWEPYYDITRDWYDEVWKLVNKETYDEIIKHIQEKYIGDSQSGNMTITIDGEEVEFTQELLDSWVGDSDVLGKYIEDVPEFEDIKTSLEHSYESAYNISARDNVWKAAKGAITDIFGESEWESYEVQKMGGKVTRHQLLFDVTDIFWEVISVHFEDYCDLDYDRDCDFEYSDFSDLCRFFMEEELWHEELNPRFDEYPNDDEIYMYFNDEASERLYW